MAEIQKQQRQEWAYIVGGYPQRFRAIELRLQKIHINVNGHCEMPGQFQIPKSTTFILIVTDQCSHAMSEKARAYAKQFKLPIIGGSYKNWCNMEARLESFGYGYRSLELVAGGQELITPEQTVQPTLGDTISKEKRAELEDRVKPQQEPIKIQTPVPSKSTPTRIMEKSLQMQEAIKTALDLNKDRLETYTNKQLAEDTGALLGYPVSNSGVGLWRKKWKIKSTPKGYKSPKKKVEPKSIQSKALEISSKESVKLTVSTIVVSTVESEVDKLQLLLNELVAKYNVSKLRILYENGEWKTDWEQVTIVQKQKTYKK